MSGRLRRLVPLAYIISPAEAHRILTFFFGKGNVNLPVAGLTYDDLEFAQALVVEAVDATAKLNWAVKISEIFLSDGTGNIGPLLKKVAKASLKAWFRHARGDNLKNPKIARTVRNVLRNNYSTSWQGRVAMGDSIWSHAL